MPKAMPPSQYAPPEQPYKFAHDYAWNWFQYHAQQRLQLFNFGLIAIGASTAACFSSFTQKWYIGAAFSAVLVTFLAAIFLRLDRRNSELTKLAEKYLKDVSEPVLAPIVGNQICLAAGADKPKSIAPYTFGQIVRLVYWLTMGSGLIAAGVAMTLALGIDWVSYTGLW